MSKQIDEIWHIASLDCISGRKKNGFWVIAKFFFFFAWMPENRFLEEVQWNEKIKVTDKRIFKELN